MINRLNSVSLKMKKQSNSLKRNHSSQFDGKQPDLWHIMTLEEKRKAAHSLGLRISDWETMQSLNAALQESEYSVFSEKNAFMSCGEKLGRRKQESVKESDDYESEEETVALVPFFETECKEEVDGEKYSDLICSLPNCVHITICQFLDSDSICYSSLVSPHWHFLRDEELYKDLCKRTYLVQSKKKTLNPNKWKGWKNMYKWRPRVRTNGFYMMRKAKIRNPQLDMWTKAKPGEILEIVYFRYFQFDVPSPGKVLYSLVHVGPEEAKSILKPGNKQAFEGTYVVQRNEVFVEVYTSYARVIFELELETGWGGGHFSKMRLTGHKSSPTSLGPQSGLIPHETTGGEYFYFHRN